MCMSIKFEFDTELNGFLLIAAQLHAELTQLNLNLPARVCVPFFDSTHQVLRVPSAESVVLNSKSKVFEYINLVLVVTFIVVSWSR